jgi:hypothetical protein
MYGSLKKNYVALNGIDQSRCYLAVIAAVLTPETLPISLVHLVWTMDHSLLNVISPSGTVSASACGTDIESYEFLMELANIRYTKQGSCMRILCQALLCMTWSAQNSCGAVSQMMGST